MRVYRKNVRLFVYVRVFGVLSARTVIVLCRFCCCFPQHLNSNPSVSYNNSKIFPIYHMFVISPTLSSLQFKEDIYREHSALFLLLNLCGLRFLPSLRSLLFLSLHPCVFLPSFFFYFPFLFFLIYVNYSSFSFSFFSFFVSFLSRRRKHHNLR